ncbi:MAG TPA: TonB family protein [Pseudomonadales bacterium]|nr:TonB family protein [Pseudomonadales bacterium]
MTIRTALYAFGLLLSSAAVAESTPAPAAAPVTPEQRAEFAEAYHTYQKLSADGNTDAALPYAQKAFELGEQIYGDDHANTAALALNLGDLLDKAGRRKDAIETLDKAIVLYKRVYGDTGRELIDPLMARGNAAGGWNAKEKSQFYDQALTIARLHVGPDDLLLARLNLEAGIHLLRDGAVDESDRYLAAAYMQYRKQLKPDDSRLLMASFWEGKYQLANQKPRAAEPYLNDVITALAGHESQPNPLGQAAHALLVVAYQQLSDPARATPHVLALAKTQPWDGSSVPVPLYKKDPDYPKDAKGLEGYAIVEFTIDADGTVSDPKLVSTQGSDAFGEPALAAIRGWRFTPHLVDGKPVATAGVKQKVDFKLVP